MAQRLSMFTNLGKYALPDPPRWRIHDLGEHRRVPVLARPTRRPELRRRGRAAPILGVSQPVLDAAAALGRLPPAARRVADGPAGDPGRGDAVGHRGDPRHRASCATTVGRELRGDRSARTGRHRRVARAEHDRGARQDQRRRPDRRSPASGPYAALSGVVEQLLVESKRARDTEAAAMNMQLVAWRDRAGRQRRVRGWGRRRPSRRGGSRSKTEDEAMPTQPSLNLIPTIQQAITSLLTTYEPEFLRFGYSLFIVVRHHPDRLARHQDDVLARRAGRPDVRVRQAAAVRLVRLLAHRLLREPAAGHRRVVQQPDHRPDGLLPVGARGPGVRQHLPALRRRCPSTSCSRIRGRFWRT